MLERKAGDLWVSGVPAIRAGAVLRDGYHRPMSAILREGYQSPTAPRSPAQSGKARPFGVLICAVLNPDPLDPIECHLIVAPVVESGCQRAFVISHFLRCFELPTVPPILRDACRPEGMTSGLFDRSLSMPATATRR